MATASTLLDRIVSWAKAQSHVRALVLVGSRAGEKPTDDLADLDLQVYAEEREAYTRDEAWLSAFAPVWVCVRDAYRHGDTVVPTRLVIFEGGTKVDFAFYPPEALTDVGSGEMQRRVLVDKEGLAPAPRHRRTVSEPPSEEEFLRIIQEFWFEAYHVAKYLARGELWLAKIRDWATKEFLLTMVEWHAGVKQGWHVDTHYGGKGMRSWATRDVWTDLQSVFSQLDAEDSWRGLHATIGLFQRLAKETAASLGVVYPDEVDRNISGFITGLERKQ